MAEPVRIEPDMKFIAQINQKSGLNLKKCYQCATCSVVCSISPDEKPFPRKEMIFASWGLKDRLIANPDIWLCFNCGDCSIHCPRDARPGDVLSALREISIKEYSRPVVLNRLLNDIRMLPLLFIVPALIILGVGSVTGLMNLNPVAKPIVFAEFFPVSLIELIFIPLSLVSALVFFLGIKRFVRDMQSTYAALNKAPSSPIDARLFITTFLGQMPAIIRHERFSDCIENKRRKISHMLVAYSFASLAFVAGAFVFALYILNSHGPYPQINPIKILANVSGVALIAGSLILIRERLGKTSQESGYSDWYLLGLACGLGITGMLTQFLRLADIAWAAYSMYFIHILLAFNLMAFLPFTKLAHLVYRTVAMTYQHVASYQDTGENENYRQSVSVPSPDKAV